MNEGKSPVGAGKAFVQMLQRTEAGRQHLADLQRKCRETSPIISQDLSAAIDGAIAEANAELEEAGFDTTVDLWELVEVVEALDVDPDPMNVQDMIKEVRLWRKRKIAELRLARKVEDERELPPEQFRELWNWAERNLVGKQLQVLRLIMQGGGVCPLAALAIDAKIDWPIDNCQGDWNNIRKALNRKLRTLTPAWWLGTRNKHATLAPAKKGQK